MNSRHHLIRADEQQEKGHEVDMTRRALFAGSSGESVGKIDRRSRLADYFHLELHEAAHQAL
jgi:hypothetical protein